MIVSAVLFVYVFVTEDIIQSGRKTIIKTVFRSFFAVFLKNKKKYLGRTANKLFAAGGFINNLFGFFSIFQKKNKNIF